MSSGKVSVIIPARHEIWLDKTIRDVLANAAGDIEVIVALDGYTPDTLPDDPRIVVLPHDEPIGMRKMFNEAAAKATGDYLMKLDAHCALSAGYDEALKRDYQEGCVVTLERYSLDPEQWKRGHGPISYEYMMWPMENPKKVGGFGIKKWCGEHGDGNNGRKSYYWMERQREHMPVDEIQGCNSACLFLSKACFEFFGGLDERYWSFYLDGVELAFKAWLSGGKLLVNKNAWHAHWWKSPKKRTVPLNWNVLHNNQAYFVWYWTHNQWPKQTRPFKWLVEHFWPIPRWPFDWEKQLATLIETPIIYVCP
jgi:glycosyltransferase involved in cell wall biosynthesis